MKENEYNTNKILFALIALTVALILLIGAAYGWFVEFPRNLIVVTGDVKIEVEGYYEIVTPDITVFTYPERLQSVNNFDSITSGQSIMYKFIIRNRTKYDARVKMKFADFSENIFENFAAYRDAGGQVAEGSALSVSINESSAVNTAKLTAVVEDLYYVSGDVIHQIPALVVNGEQTERYFWRYLAGNPLFEGILIPGNGEITVYYAFRSLQSGQSLSEYELWLLGDGETPGYAQEYLAAELGYTFDALPQSDKDMIDGYLSYYFDQERGWLGNQEGGSPILRLTIDNYIFIGESI